ncbi:uncharacterized protein AB675_6166 [Cyphellophora attinorum]|uniref:Uncharacterized protein n=1 Tax=Cyphellophora attinorum TaxID=1664694 RepID=A0A0N1HEP4_9EURO|nr:uncharacterized protein AB675_6166 [Phialophora attinorum]KPI43963.1 hypothetical protein AB675_6166 [Phialophora attinorum]
MSDWLDGCIARLEISFGPWFPLIADEIVKINGTIEDTDSAMRRAAMPPEWFGPAQSRLSEAARRPVTPPLGYLYVSSDQSISGSSSDTSGELVTPPERPTPCPANPAAYQNRLRVRHGADVALPHSKISKLRLPSPPGRKMPLRAYRRRRM